MPWGGARTNPWQNAQARARQQNQRFITSGGAAPINMSPTYGAPGRQTSNVLPWAQSNIPGYGQGTTNQQAQALKALYGSAYQASNQPAFPGSMPGGPGGGGRGGGGGGGGGGGPAGLDQGTIDWLMSQFGQGRPDQLAYTPLDLADPSQYMKWDPAQYGVARQGVATGIEGIRGRGMTAFDQARGELGRYTNPYETGLQTKNPDLQAAMQRMMAANNVNPGQVGATNAEGVQADQAMGNTLAMLAATDQARQAGNLRALGGDVRTFDQNLGLEGNMLNLGVNMAEAKGKTAFDQALQQAMMEAANQEAMQNWQRQNAVGDTNVANRNEWNQGLINMLLQLIPSAAPGTVFPADMTGAYA
jgi:hypothetical protein